jgi:uncharacterized protein
MWIPRLLEKKILELVKTRPAVLLTGVRQSGKSSLLKNLFPNAEYISFDRILTAQSAEENPREFLNKLQHKKQVILDEIQYAPSLFRELKIIIDENRGLFGKWILTGSQYFPLMKNTSESLAGRIALLHLETLSANELKKSKLIKKTDDILWKGGYPETWAYPEINIIQYFNDYIQTYMEKDLRELVKVSNLRDFNRFIRACAIRIGQLVNFTDIAKDIGVSGNTIKTWINTLESSGLIVMLEPYYANIGKRLIKAPKLYFTDQGLLCSILNITDYSKFKDHIYEGSIWENFVFTELIKTDGIEASKNLFFYRDQNNVEIDFIIEINKKIIFIEAKASERVQEQKLNFKKIVNLFPNNKTSSIIACRIDEDAEISMKDYSMINPMRTGFKFFE